MSLSPEHDPELPPPSLEECPPADPSPHRRRRSKQEQYAQWMALGLVALAVIMAITLLPGESAATVFWGAAALVTGGFVGIKGIQYWPQIQAGVRRIIAILPLLPIRLRKQRARIGFLAGVLVLGLMVQAALLIEPGASDARLEAGLIYFSGGVAAAGVGWLTMTYPTHKKPVRLLNRTNWLVFGGGVLALWTVAEANAQLVGWKAVEGWPQRNQLLLLCAGVGLVVLGLGGLRWLKEFRLSRAGLVEMVAVMAVTLIGFGLRMWELETAAHRFVDELNFGTVVTYFEGTRPIPLLHPTIRGFPALYAYLQHFGVVEYGRTLAGLRVASVVFGTLTLPAVYLLGRELYGKRTGIIAASLLAAFPPHIQYSRLGLNNIADPLFATLAFAALARAIHSQKRRDYALSGACLGLTQYFYEGGRLLYPPLMLAWVGVGLVVWRPRVSVKGFWIAVLAFVVVAAPIYYTLYGIEAPFTPRMDEVGRVSETAQTTRATTGREVYLERLKTVFKIYTTLPEGPVFYYGGDYGLLTVALVPCFLLGAAFSLWRFRAPSCLLVIWVVSTSLGNTIVNLQSVSARYVVVFPALVLLAAVGIRETGALLWPKNLPRYAQHIVIAGLVIGLCIYQVDFFMGPQLARFNQQIRSKNRRDGEDALFRATELPLGTHIYLIGDDVIDYAYAQGIMQYLKPGMSVEVLAPEDMSWSFIRTFGQNENAAFFLMAHDTQTLDRLRHFYTLLPAQESPYNVPDEQELILYYAPAYLEPPAHPPDDALVPQP